MADVETQAKAAEIGWAPKEEFRGDPNKWVDADEFLRRGEEILPLVKSQNRRLQVELEATKGELGQIKELLTASQEAIEELQAHQSETTKAAVERARKDLRAQIRVAREAGDAELEEALQDQLDDVNEARRAVKDKEERTPTATQPPKNTPDPEFIAWKADNPWFETDKRRSALMIVEAQELRNDPANRNLLSRAFYEKASANVDAILNPRAPTKVDTGTRGSGGGGGSGSGETGKSFADLPKEAKDVCSARTSRLVGPGRAFKTEKEWQAAYARDFFAQE